MVRLMGRIMGGFSGRAAAKKLSDALSTKPGAAYETHAGASKNAGDDTCLPIARRGAEAQLWRRPVHPRGAVLTQPPVIWSLLGYLAVERGLAANSIDACRRDLASVTAFLSARGVELQLARGDDFRAYLREQRRAGRSTATIIRRITSIRSFLHFRFATLGITAARQIAAVIAELEYPKEPQYLPTVLTRSETARLIACPGRRSWLFPRDLAILELLYASGMRASELLAVQLRDVAGASRAIRVFGKGSIERIVFYGRAAAEAIARYLSSCRPRLDPRGASDRLFLSCSGRPLQRRRLYSIVCGYARAGRLPRIGPHVLRHCFASHLLGGGADLRVIQELLGHATIETTERYVHVDYQRLKEIHRRYHPRG